jgi:hypothetical protein
VGNYLKPGPESVRRPPIVLAQSANVEYFLADNLVEGWPEFQINDGRFFTPQEAGGRPLYRLVSRPFPAPPVRTTSAAEAYREVLEGAGATRPVRDAVDARIIAEVRSGSGRIIDSTRQVGGWPAYPPAEAPLDSDGDGMPDLWERRHGLNPHDSTDAASGWNGDGYTNIEEYLNALADGTARVEDFLQGPGNTHAVSARTRSGNHVEPRHRLH